MRRTLTRATYARRGALPVPRRRALGARAFTALPRIRWFAYAPFCAFLHALAPGLRAAAAHGRNMPRTLYALPVAFRLVLLPGAAWLTTSLPHLPPLHHTCACHTRLWQTLPPLHFMPACVHCCLPLPCHHCFSCHYLPAIHTFTRLPGFSSLDLCLRLPHHYTCLLSPCLPLHTACLPPPTAFWTGSAFRVPACGSRMHHHLYAYHYTHALLYLWMPRTPQFCLHAAACRACLACGSVTFHYRACARLRAALCCCGLRMRRAALYVAGRWVCCSSAGSTPRYRCVPTCLPAFRRVPHRMRGCFCATAPALPLRHHCVRCAAAHATYDALLQARGMPLAFVLLGAGTVRHCCLDAPYAFTRAI